MQDTEVSELALLAREVGVKDLGLEGSATHYQAHGTCGERLRIGQLEGDVTLIYWCAECVCPVAGTVRR